MVHRALSPRRHTPPRIHAEPLGPAFVKKRVSCPGNRASIPPAGWGTDWSPRLRTPGQAPGARRPPWQAGPAPPPPSFLLRRPASEHTLHMAGRPSDRLLYRKDGGIEHQRIPGRRHRRVGPLGVTFVAGAEVCENLLDADSPRPPPKAPSSVVRRAPSSEAVTKKLHLRPRGRSRCRCLGRRAPPRRPGARRPSGSREQRRAHRGQRPRPCWRQCRPRWSEARHA